MPALFSTAPSIRRLSAVVFWPVCGSDTEKRALLPSARLMENAKGRRCLRSAERFALTVFRAVMNAVQGELTGIIEKPCAAGAAARSIENIGVVAEPVDLLVEMVR